jgi:glycosyltransferase involved in cell wall biosynthesis
MSNISVIGSERTYPSRLPARSLWGFLRRWTYGRLSTVVAQTQDAATWLRMNTAARCVVVIPNPTEWPLPVQAPILAPETIIAPKTHVLLSVGRLDGVKGFDCLIDVFTALAAKHPNWNLVILGDGPQRKTLEAQASKHGMETRIFLPGIVGNVAQWYSHADLYVLSSRFEGFPNSLVEALAHGLPAVSFDCDSGPREIIRHGVDGLLIPAGDVPALRSALDKVMADQSMRYGFAERASEARERFSIRRIAGMWEDLFLRLQ